MTPCPSTATARARRPRKKRRASQRVFPSSISSVSGGRLSISGVMMNPGPTTFTRTLCGAYSSAAVCVRPTIPCLAATYAGDPRYPTWERMEPMLTMAPPPRLFRSRRVGSAFRRKTPDRLIEMTLSQPSIGYSPVGAIGPPMPALLTATCRAPKRRTASWSERLAFLGARGVGLEEDRLPTGTRDALQRRETARVVDVGDDDLAPSAASLIAISRPMPLPAPVTSATRDSRAWNFPQGAITNRRQMRWPPDWATTEVQARPRIGSVIPLDRVQAGLRDLIGEHGHTPSLQIDDRDAQVGFVRHGTGDPCGRSPDGIRARQGERQFLRWTAAPRAHGAE